jgi:hypothetical protein
MLLALLCGSKSDFLDFLGEATPAAMDKTAKWQNLQRQLFRATVYEDVIPKQSVTATPTPQTSQRNK